MRTLIVKYNNLFYTFNKKIFFLNAMKKFEFDDYLKKLFAY